MPIRPRLPLVIALAVLATDARAQAPSEPPADRDARQVELRGVETNLKASEAEQRRIEADVEAIKLDHARLNEALLATTARLQKTEADRADATARLAKSAADQTALQATFGDRRARLANLLAALQRMTHDAPPAILVRPDDMAAAVRAAGVVSALIGDVKAQSDALSRDLARAQALKQAIDEQRVELQRSAEDLALDQARLAALVEARQKALGDRESALVDAGRRADKLASQASSLKDLIARMDGDVASADAGASRAARGGDLARLKPAVAFSDMKGRLAWPAVGTPIKAFGDPDGLGGQLKGVALQTPPGATVSTPADAWVAFAGPYRSYGQLLILNAGEGYYLVLAGMDRIQVAVGQFVLSGEPVAMMGSGAARAAAAAPIGAEPPVLYIELRKNDSVVDPQPWWAKSNLEKARG